MAYKTYNDQLPVEIADIMNAHQIPVDYKTYWQLETQYKAAAAEGETNLADYLADLERKAGKIASMLDEMQNQTGSPDRITEPFVYQGYERRYSLRPSMRVQLPGVDDTNRYKVWLRFQAFQTYPEHEIARPGTPRNRLDIPVWCSAQIPTDTEQAQVEAFEWNYYDESTGDVFAPVSIYEIVGLYIVQRVLLGALDADMTLSDMHWDRRFLASLGCIPG